jgi:photosynthesis system II assembly factor YCF48-like protein
MWNPIVLYDEDLVNDERPPAAEQSVHRLLTHALREEDAPYAGNCLDAETVAAWMDGALAADVLAAAETHAAGCARCQAVLSAMARTAPPVARRSWWPASLTLRWLVPAAAAATAAALWILVAPPASRPDATVPSSELDRVAPSPAPLLTQSSPPAATSATTTPPERENTTSVPALEKRKEPAAREQSSAKPLDSLEALRDRSETAKPSDEFKAEAAKQEEFRPKAPAAAPLVDAPAAARAPGPPPISEIAGFRAARVLLTEIVSPDPASRWRAGAAGVIYHSADGGITWAPQQTGIQAELIAGSSPARDVCWVVGRGGVVLLSTDGTTWQQRPFPEKVDLVAVSATDAKTAAVTTTDGRRFSTTDGGATWFRPSPQESPAAPFYQ